MTARKVHVILGQDGDALTMAEDGGVQPLPSSQVRALLQALADLWWWTVLVLAGVSLVRLRSCRAAWVLWLTPILFLVLSLPGVALDRYHHPMAPFLTCLAACALASARPAGSWSPSGEERSGAAGSAREDLVDVST